MDEALINRLVVNIIDTFKFYGIEIVKMSLDKDVPEFSILVSKSHLKYDLNKTLDFAYWTLSALVAGSPDALSSSTKTIKLNYRLVESKEST